MVSYHSAWTHWQVSTDIEGITWAVLDRKDAKANSLSKQILEELDGLVKNVAHQAKDDKTIGLVIASGKDNGFIAGADIKEFEAFKSEADVVEGITHVHEIFNRLENLNIPTVAAIDGFCLGGGLELVLACDYRIATRKDTTRLGFPEVKLGLFPGFGGTARSVRQLGPVMALTAMLSGRMYKATAARKMGLVDALVPTSSHLKWAARKAIMQKRHSKSKARFQRLLTYHMVRSIMARKIRKQTAKKAKPQHYPAPYALIKHWEDNGASFNKLLAGEAERFAPLMMSKTSQNLRRVFWGSEALKRQANPIAGFNPKRVHVIGAGVMGGDIAAWCALQGFEVSLQDRELSYVEKAITRAHKLFAKRLKNPLLIKAAQTRLIADVHGQHIPRADIVIEAIFENLEAKHDLFKSIEPRLKPEAVLATNTSALPLEDIASVLEHKDRLIGLHFFNPVASLPLVEVVKSQYSRASEVSKALAFVKKIKKSPLVVKSSPGFLVNRVLLPYMAQAMNLYNEGVDQMVLDKAATDFGMPVGPIELADQVGLDICQDVIKTLGVRLPQSNPLNRLVGEKKLGKKTGEGFYKWEKGRPIKDLKLLEEYLKEDVDLKELAHRMIMPLLTASKACLEEGIVENDMLLDAGVIFGTGFAPFRGGPLHYLESLSQEERDARPQAPKTEPLKTESIEPKPQGENQ